ncbi:hypothetical protein E1263_17765 [Kribbella antibiotica]|uniref:Uncharacterized protein n=1 Tax=Kribbella antibiotica TaxID=190195 RepID=A0A4R4ZM66_9ACTN|nr:hypothetical protein [Kribbella antibiotica]TDD58759.1 hypothetical protein E1263_17765 [Kribbella antibiotica]
MKSSMRPEGLVVVPSQPGSAEVLSVAGDGSADYYQSFGTALPDRADLVVTHCHLWNSYGDGRNAHVRPAVLHIAGGLSGG